MTPAGFPHSDTSGSQPSRRLPGAFRSLTRPSSAPGAKASSVPTRGSYLVEGSCVFGRIASDRPCYRHGWRLPELLRKEVIQPHLPVRLPCYDFTPIASPTFDGSLPKGWATGFGCCPLSWCDGRCVQGPGTYSPQRC